MILTLTPNPATDITLALPEKLERGSVLRLNSVTAVAGGKGVNVAHAVALAGMDTLALFPAGPTDRFCQLVDEAEIPYAAIPVEGEVRINTAVTESDGTTTKLNGPGSVITADVRSDIEESVLRAITEHHPRCIVLAGSLPPGISPDWYSHLIRLIREHSPEVRIAVDTSDKPMEELGKHLNTAAPDVLKPNGLELGQLIGTDGAVLEEEAAAGNYAPVVSAATELNRRGVAEVLVTLGGAGAVLITSEGAWVATTPPAPVVSTVGAGDSALAGYLMARSTGLDPAACLQQAVAYGTAAASLPGTTIPDPSLIDVSHTSVTPFIK